ncbi:MAG: thiol oxidoreductase [Acidobacteriaceae bacterium]|nr:thiol oxidoreductase [Acidobacteriaceae bacterium]
MENWKRAGIVVTVMAGITLAGSQRIAQDAGPRSGPPGAGGYYPMLNATEQAAFANGIAQFVQDEGVPDNPPGSGNGGLGPGFNGTSCGSCHAQPATLGSSPAANPQIAAAAEMSASNTIPPFILPNGPVREARFVRLRDGTPDGGVHNLFTIAGRTDAPGCNLRQPDFAAELAANNVIFRIPTPVFGLGLVENTPDSVLRSNLADRRDRKSDLGIAGHFNTSPNDGTISKFGWKAQNKSLNLFAGEAYNVEMGVTNDVMSNERNAASGCVFNATPEDSHAAASNGISDVDAFVDAMRLSAPPTPSAATAHTQEGQEIFNRVGCVLCHSDSLSTTGSLYTGMSNVTYHPFSDFALHHMGARLADGIAQGAAGPDEFRTAPLWGIGQRLFFLHDGRTSDLLDAIEEHRSVGSEANAVVEKFNQRSLDQKQALLDFLRSL